MKTILVLLLLVFPANQASARKSAVSGVPQRTPETRVFIPPYDHERTVRHWIRYLRNEGRSEFRRWTRQMGHYAALYQKIFTAHSLPPELVWLSGMESGCDRNAVSEMGAGGLWQFLPATGRVMGLRVDGWVDERFDPEASTLAAARHLHGLYKRFKKWPLVLASYHAGERWVARSIKRYKTDDYFKLARFGAFQESTQIYVPKALAFIAMAAGPEEYEVAIPRQPEDLREDLVIVPPGTSLRDVADAAKLPHSAVRMRNPALRKGKTPPAGDPVSVRLPWGMGWRVVANLEGAKPARPKDVMEPIRYKVRAGDTIWTLARRFGVKMKEVLVMNGISDPRRIRVGQELLLPPPGSAQRVRERS
jgi:membrane-bound lytic murein transglycosylase D